MYEKCPTCGRGSAADKWKPRARVESVIIVEYLEGDGTADNIMRIAKAIYTLDGTLIAIVDPDAVNGKVPFNPDRKAEVK